MFTQQDVWRSQWAINTLLSQSYLLSVTPCNQDIRATPGKIHCQKLYVGLRALVTTVPLVILHFAEQLLVPSLLDGPCTWYPLLLPILLMLSNYIWVSQLEPELDLFING